MLILPLQSVYSTAFPLFFHIGLKPQVVFACIYISKQCYIDRICKITQHNITPDTQKSFGKCLALCVGVIMSFVRVFFSPILLGFLSSHLNIRVCEATHKWPQTLASLRECSSKTKIFLYLPKTEFQSVNSLVFSV